MRDAVRKKRLVPPKNAKGMKSPRAKLTDRAVIEIRRRAKQGETQRTLGKEYGMGKTTVAHVIHGRTWSHVISAN